MLQPGDTFGDYRVLKLLGQGGMGSVFLLENAEGAQVAAKILDPAEAGDAESRKRFLREAELALGVKHPNLVETYDVGEDPDTGLCYILMEYMSGGSLADDLKENGALPIEDAVAVVQAMASVLELARQKGIVHRDIKPGNIMFDAEGTPKLADLGIARGGIAGTETTTVTQTGMMIGTPAYMAPEQMLDAHHVDTRADIYSLGVVFFEMLTGERPNKDDTVVQLMARAVKGEPLPDVRTLRPEVSASLAQLLAMMVAPDKDGRISTPGQITSALDIIERGGTFESAHAKAQRREALRVERRRRRRRHRLLLVAVLGVAAAVGLAGIGLGITWLVRERDAPVPADTIPQPRPSASDSQPVRDSDVRKTEAAHEDEKANHRIVVTNQAEPVVSVIVVTNVVEREIVPPVETKGDDETNEGVAVQGETDRRLRTAEVDGHTWSYWLENGEAVISGSRGERLSDARAAVFPVPSGCIRVPSHLDGYPVAVLGDRAFASCDQLQAVEVPDTVRAVRGWGTFYRCQSLIRVELPDSLREIIGQAVFMGCDALEELDLRRCEKFDGFALRFCPRFACFRLDEANASFQVIDDMLLSRDGATLIRCPEAKEDVRLPPGLRQIGRGAFVGCRMRRFAVPEGVDTVDTYAFAFCPELEEVSFPKSLKSLGDRTFFKCNRLKTVRFEGDSPSLAGGCGEWLFAWTPEDLKVAVRRGTRGWASARSAELPKQWPCNGKNSRGVVVDREVSDAEQMIEVPVPFGHKKVLPSLKSAACELKCGNGIAIKAEEGCGKAARILSRRLGWKFEDAKSVFGPLARRDDFVVELTRTGDRKCKTPAYCPGRRSWKICLPIDDDDFCYGLEELLATAWTVCYEPDWQLFVRYGACELARVHGSAIRNELALRDGDNVGIGMIFQNLEGGCPDVFTKYQTLKNRKFANGEIPEEIDYDTVADLLTTVSGRNVVDLFRRAGLGSRLRNKGPVGANATKGAPPNMNDGKSFDMLKMRGSTFQKTLQKTLDQVFPPWRLGSDYQGQVKLMSGRGRGETLGYVSKVLDRQHVVVLPLHFGVLTPVLSCRRKMGEREKLLCSVAFGQGIESCELVVQVNGRECYRATLNDAVLWEDFEVDLSDWKGKSSKIDIMARCDKGGPQGGVGLASYGSDALLYVQRLEWGKR